MKDEVDLLVSVDDAHRGKLAAVAHRLERAGMRVDALHEESGTLAGRASEALVPVLKAVAGVLSVERARPERAV